MTQVAPLAGYQNRIYLEGLGGRLPGCRSPTRRSRSAPSGS